MGLQGTSLRIDTAGWGMFSQNSDGEYSGGLRFLLRTLPKHDSRGSLLKRGFLYN
jgi:hypothetical protein